MKSISIIIPVHNQKVLLKRCIESIRKKTKIPYKLIIVDDASDKEIADYCKSLKHIKYIRNKKQKGFSYTCNRGIKAIKSDYYCLLNSDAEIATEDWLCKIIKVGESDSKIGILGVLSNNATSQSVPIRSPDAARYLAQLTENKNPEVSLVNGFCYVIKQNVIDKIGLLDEKRYPHYGSEDDYTFRAIQKYFKAIIIDSVFVFHKSNASYKNTREQLVSKSIPQFYSDWGNEKVEAAIKQSYEATAYLRDKITAFYENKKLPISVCMIVKNEEDCLRRCLSSISCIASEIIIVDTGSTDDTVLLAKEFNTKIYHYKWNDDFAAARNFSLSKAAQKWIFILDADEYISSKDLSKFEKLLDKNAYRFVTRNYVNDRNIEGLIIDRKYEETRGYIGWCKSEKVRLFPNKKNVKFSGTIHEFVEDSLTCKILDCDIPIHHYGFVNKKDKKKYYLKLGIKKLDINDLQSTVELANQYLSFENYHEALVLFRKVLTKYPKEPAVLAQMGTTYNFLKDYAQAEKYFLKSLKIQKSEYAYKHLAICYAKQLKYDKAYKCFKSYPHNDLKSLGDFAYCCIKLKKYDEANDILKKAELLDAKAVKSWGMLEFIQRDITQL